jgi:DNA-directed RNA polymerase alpha subunit
VSKEYRLSVNTPDFPIAQWIINSAQAAVLDLAGILPKHWNIAGDVVTEMSPAEKAIVDAAELEASRDATMAAALDDLEEITRAFTQLVRGELNILRALHALPDRTLAQLRSAMRSSLGT